MGIIDRLKGRHSDEPEPTTQDLEQELRSRLEEDPNDREALIGLAEILAAPQEEEIADPLTAAHEPISAAVNRQTALWALAEDYAGNPHAWVPLIELARILVSDDEEGAIKRLATACDRETTGKALANSVAMLRENGLTSQALSLGVAKWAPATQSFEAGTQLVRAAIEARDPGRARELVSRLGDAHPEEPEVAELEAAINDLEAALTEGRSPA